MLTRIIVGLLLTALLGALITFTGIFRIAVFSVAAVIAVHEMGALFKAKGYSLFLWPAYVFAALQFALSSRFEGAAVLLLFVCIAAVAVERVFSKTRTTEESMYSLFIMLYPLGLFWALTGVCTANVQSTPMLLLFVCPLMGDTMAFFVGSFFGKHKLCPHISPKKTVEGSVGGFIGGALGGLIVYYAQGLWGLSAALWPMLIVGLVCGGVGQIGDLFASVLKRWAGVKDYGTLFPGHGGVMDRLDSVLMCAPVVLAYMYATVM